MKLRLRNQPGSVDAVLVPSIEHAKTDFRAFIGLKAEIYYTGKHLAILHLDRADALSCDVGQWLVRDLFGNLSVWDDFFLRQIVVDLPERAKESRAPGWQLSDQK